MQQENLNLATNISNSRKKLGLSQEALAEKANVSLSTIQRIEKGTVKPRAFTLKILAETLSLDISELIAKPTQSVNSELVFSSLKKMNLITLLFVFLPFINLIIPFFYGKKTGIFNRKITLLVKL